MLCGDFNFPDIDWVNLAAHSRLSKNFLDLCLMFNFAQMVSMPTRGANILDLVLVSTPDLVKSIQCVDGVSDHKTLLIGLSIPIPTRQPLNKYIRDYNKADFPKINDELADFHETFFHSAASRTVEQNWLLFKNKLLSLIDRYVPLVCIRGDAERPWYSNSLRRLSRKKKRLFREAKLSKSPSKWEKYRTCLSEYTSLLKNSKGNFIVMIFSASCVTTHKNFGSIWLLKTPLLKTCPLLIPMVRPFPPLTLPKS